MLNALPPPRSLVAAILTLTVLGAGVEAYWRRAAGLDPAFCRFLFLARLSAERWSFLEANRDRLQTEPVTHLPPGQDMVMQPQGARPAFDRTVAPFRLVTNADGYRERPFAWRAGQPVWFALGDSVTFGQGVERADRFTDRLQKALPAGTFVLNFGVPGCTSACMAEILDRYAARRPALVILQATANDYDLTQWRQTRQAPLGGLRARAFKVASQSHALLCAQYKLSADLFDRRMRETLAAAAAFYRPDLERLARTLKARGIPLVVVEVPLATGLTVTGPVADFFRGRPDVCRGVLRVSFDGSEDDIPDWVAQTAQELGVDERRLAPALPYRRFFQDIVHPNALGNELIAAQLLRFLAARRLLLPRAAGGAARGRRDSSGRPEGRGPPGARAAGARLPVR